VLPFLLRRLVAAIPVLFGVSLLAFSMTHLTPGDPVAIAKEAKALESTATASAPGTARSTAGTDSATPEGRMASPGTYVSPRRTPIGMNSVSRTCSPFAIVNRVS